MASSLYRRQSMVQLYEKLRAQDDDDDMAWLAQYSPDDKSDDQFVPAPPTLSSPSPISSSFSSGSSMSDHASDSESSDGYFSIDSDSDVDPEPLELDLACTDCDPSPPLPLIFQSNDDSAVTEPSDPPEVSLVEERSPSPSRSLSPLVESDAPPVGSPSDSYYPTARSTRKSSARRPSPAMLDQYGDSESDGDASEDEYIPSPALGASKRRRSVRPASSASVSPSQKRGAESGSRKRPRHSPQPRNIQATPGMTPASAAAKNNPWACPYCKWVQRNHRTPDLKRHIRTHTRLQRPAQWVCCGVPVKDAENYSISENAESYMWEGEEMIGGCRKEFSRRDALKRHLDNEHIHCVGNFAAFASICEDEI